MAKQEHDENGEYEVTSFLANRYHYMFECDGGKMTITNQRLIFKPHMLNTYTNTSEIPLADITSITRFNTLWFIPNGIVIETSDGKTHRFVVGKRDTIIDLINEHRSKAKRGE